MQHIPDKKKIASKGYNEQLKDKNPIFKKKAKETYRTFFKDGTQMPIHIEKLVNLIRNEVNTNKKIQFHNYKIGKAIF